MHLLTLVLSLASGLADLPYPDPADEARLAMDALRLDAGERVIMDGRLDEAFWQRVAPASQFRQQEPQEGAPATEQTEVRVAYDAQHLYIGVLLHDRDPRGVIGRALQRDAGLGSDDRFMFILDTFLDGRSAYFFEINPAGLMGDGLLRGRDVNKSWDGIWEARVHRGEHGWSAEIRIPFRTLNFDPGRDEWGINFQRTVRRKSEESLWSGHGRNQGLARPEHAGRLRGLEGMSQGIGLEVKPYTVASWQQAPGRGVEGTRTPASIGMDVTYSITPGLRASLTLNTDFAEAEVDQRRVNLTRFPLMFPERRDFFLEGSGVFTFAASSGPNPYFSRRIGLVDGNPVPVVAGARLAGQAGPWDVGFLQVRTGEHDAGPTEDFTVARVRRNILRSSMIGAVFTRRAGHAADTLPAVEAHTFGFDVDLVTSRFLGSRNLQFEAFAVAHDNAAAHEASTLLDRSVRGIRIAYPNTPVRAHVSLREFGAHYDPAVGFVSRRAFRRFQPTLGWAPLPDWGAVRQLDFQAQVEHITDLSGRLETFNVSGRLPGVRFESGDYVELEMRRDFERLASGFVIHPGVTVPAGDHTASRWDLSLRTAGRRAVSMNAAVSGGGFWSGRRTQTQLGLQLTPAPGISAGASWEYNDVSLPGGAFDTNLFRVVGGWQLSPWTSLNGSVQYDDVSRIIGTFTRLRWSVRPGSDIFLVYTHNLRDAALDADPRRGLVTLDRQASTKVTYTHRF
jgi:hypothetical protein